MSNITFVSAYIKIYKDNEEWRTDYDENKDNHSLYYFELLADTGIQIHLYLNNYFKKQGDYLLDKYKNIKIDYIELSDLWTYKEVEKRKNLQLPIMRDMNKDNSEFLILMNAKLELIDKSIKTNYYNSDYFSWIDYRIFHVLKNVHESQEYLKKIVSSKLKDEFLAMCGCWPKGSYILEVFQKINWRFCGGFFIGDKKSMLSFISLYYEKFPEILNKNNTLAWEVNIWVILEYDYGLQFEWYLGDHNDSIIRLPEIYFI